MDECDIKNYLEYNLKIKLSTENHSGSNCLAVELWLGNNRIDYDWINTDQISDWYY